MILTDQASKLRELARDIKPRARTIAITSGKGGVGKTNVAVCLAISLAAREKKVILLDADLGLANADILLDVNPAYNLSDVIDGTKTLREVILSAPGGISIVPGVSGIARIANLPDSQRNFLLDKFYELESLADHIIIDTGAGVSRNVINIASAADDIIVIATPEPTSITDAYAVIKMISGEPAHGRIHLLLNMVKCRDEAQIISSRIASVCSQFLGMHVKKLGFVLYDEKVPHSVMRRRPVLLEYPRSLASQCIKNVGRYFCSDNGNPLSDKRKGFFGTVAQLFLK